jgi:anti-sigma factor RsiW
MQCERARDLVSPYLDGELSPGERSAVAAHIEGCRACAAEVADFQRIGRTIAEMGREPTPKALALRVRAKLARAAEAEDAQIPLQSPAKLVSSRPSFASRYHMRQAAVIAAACIISAFATWWVTSAVGQQQRLEQEVLAAHVRSLLQESPIQVASSDAHTVKPWFAGRIDFSPDVKDLAAEGFPLLGGRLDYVGGRRVGAIVYKRRLHTINVFMWPSGSAEDAAASLVTRNGYNLLAWSHGGITYWAVSDLSPGDLRQLQNLM